MSTHAADVGHRVHAARIWRPWMWLPAGLLLAFAVPFVLADALAIERDVYIGLYALAVGAFFASWVRATGRSFADVFSHRLVLATALGLVFAGVMAVFAIRAEASTPRPSGLELAAALGWRGIVYGLADGLLLSAFPIMAVFALFAASPLRQRFVGNVAIGVAALAFSLAVTAVYHLGYSDFRSGKVARPVSGDLIWSIPTLATLNPVGAPIAHTGVHVAAVVHSYDTDLFLPPHSGGG
jgi:hypothetical protein